MPSSELKMLLNSYKTNIPTKIFNSVKETILKLPENKEELDRLDDKLNSIITPEINGDKFYKEIKGAIQTDIINRVTGFTYNVDSRIRGPINNMITDTITGVFNGEDIGNIIIGNVNDMKDLAINTITSEVNGAISKHVNQFSGKILGKINDTIYSINDPTGTIQIVGNFLNNTVNGISGALTSGVNNLLNGGAIDTSIVNQIGTNLNSAFDNIKGNLVNQANNFMQSSLNKLSEKIGFDISSVFSAPTISLDNGNLSLKGGGIKEGALGGVFDKNKPNTDSINSKERIKQNAQKSAQARRTDDATKPDNINNNDNATTSPSVKDRNNQNSNSGDSNNNDEPKEEQYDNSIPPRATVKNDPRRDKCQELVLWEGSSEKYVLLRDGIGNYICMDETKNTLRLQHPSGSFIEFRSNGDIIISSAKHVRINCEGASFINKF